MTLLDDPTMEAARVAWVDRLIEAATKRSGTGFQEYDPHSGKYASHFPVLYDLTKGEAQGGMFHPVGGPLGSNGGQWYEHNETHQRFLVKPAKSPLHAYNEVAMGQVYREAGIDVPRTRFAEDTPGHFVVISEGVDFVPAQDMPTSQIDNLQFGARKGFGVDALTSNWDVYGLTGDNAGVDPGSGSVIRIDAGGAGLFRAQGSPKDSFAPGKPWTEPSSMRTSPQGQAFYGKMTDAEAAQSLQHAQNVNLHNVEKRLDSLGVPHDAQVKILSPLYDRQTQIPTHVKALSGPNVIHSPSSNVTIDKKTGKVTDLSAPKISPAPPPINHGLATTPKPVAPTKNLQHGAVLQTGYGGQQIQVGGTVTMGSGKTFTVVGPGKKEGYLHVQTSTGHSLAVKTADVKSSKIAPILVGKGKGVHPGDIVTTSKGKTFEVVGPGKKEGYLHVKTTDTGHSLAIKSDSVIPTSGNVKTVSPSTPLTHPTHMTTLGQKVQVGDQIGWNGAAGSHPYTVTALHSDGSVQVTSKFGSEKVSASVLDGAHAVKAPPPWPGPKVVDKHGLSVKVGDTVADVDGNTYDISNVLGDHGIVLKSTHNGIEYPMSIKALSSPESGFAKIDTSAPGAAKLHVGDKVQVPGEHMGDVIHVDGDQIQVHVPALNHPEGSGLYYSKSDLIPAAKTPTPTTKAQPFKTLSSTKKGDIIVHTKQGTEYQVVGVYAQSIKVKPVGNPTHPGFLIKKQNSLYHVQGHEPSKKPAGFQAPPAFGGKAHALLSDPYTPAGSVAKPASALAPAPLKKITVVDPGTSKHQDYDIGGQYKVTGTNKKGGTFEETVEVTGLGSNGTFVAHPTTGYWANTPDKTFEYKNSDVKKAFDGTPLKLGQTTPGLSVAPLGHAEALKHDPRAGQGFVHLHPTSATAANAAQSQKAWGGVADATGSSSDNAARSIRIGKTIQTSDPEGWEAIQTAAKSSGHAPLEWVGLSSNSWDGSSNGTHAVALQHAISARFGIPVGRSNTSGEVEWQKHPRAYAAVRDAIYADTQKQLAAQGVRSMVVFRGVSQHIPDGHSGVEKKLKLHAASSFSTSSSKAKGFGGSHVLVANVESERIFSLGGTGPGTGYEHEVVVMGGSDGVVAAVYSSSGFSSAGAITPSAQPVLATFAVVG